MTLEPGTLQESEYHPAADSAMRYLKNYIASDIENTMRLREAFSTSALSGNRLAEICAETLRRILESEPVSDRYLLGLCWTLKEIEENKDK